MKKNLSIIIIFLALIIFIHPTKIFAVSQTIDSNINKIDDKKYPGVKKQIQNLQKLHPNWSFKVLYTGLNWNEVIEAESKHGRNLIGKNLKNYSGDWICKECGNKGYSGSNWLCASEDAIKYMMDPRNSIYYADVFQFLELSYNSSTNYKTDIIKSILQDSFLDDGNLDKYIKTIMDESKKKNVNPYYIATKIIQEQGKKGGATFKMKENEDAKEFYYNIFNINAGGKTVASIISNALSWAKDKGWNSIEKSLSGGIEFIAKGYISVGQNTMYFEKFDVIANYFYSHQYAQDVLYAQNQGEKVRKILEGIKATEYAYTFVIPLYEGMPKNACGRPSTSTSNTSNTNANSSQDNNNSSTSNNIISSDNTNTSTTSNNASNSNGSSNTNTSSSSNNTNNSTTPNSSNNENNSLNSTEKNAYTGDVDNNNKIDAMDMYKIIQYMLGKQKLNASQIKAADLNKDGKLDAMDMYLLIQKIKKK